MLGRKQHIANSDWLKALAMIRDRTITIERSNIPLYILRTEHGTYFCSRKFERSEEFPNNSKNILTV